MTIHTTIHHNLCGVVVCPFVWRGCNIIAIVIVTVMVVVLIIVLTIVIVTVIKRWTVLTLMMAELITSTVTMLHTRYWMVIRLLAVYT